MYYIIFMVYEVLFTLQSQLSGRNVKFWTKIRVSAKTHLYDHILFNTCLFLFSTLSLKSSTKRGSNSWDFTSWGNWGTVAFVTWYVSNSQRLMCFNKLLCHSGSTAVIQHWITLIKKQIYTLIWSAKQNPFHTHMLKIVF